MKTSKVGYTGPDGAPGVLIPRPIPRSMLLALSRALSRDIYQSPILLDLAKVEYIPFVID